MSDISQLADRALMEANMNKQRGQEIFLDLLTQYPQVGAEFDAKTKIAGASQEMHLAAHRTQSDSESILDNWVLSCDKPLGDATAEELIEEAEAQAQIKNDAATKEKFYLGIVQGMREQLRLDSSAMD